MRTRIALVFGAVIVLILSSFSAAGQQSIGDKRITIHLERAGFGKVVEVLIEKCDVAVGFEQSLSLNTEDAWDFEPKTHWFSVNFDEAKLSEVMESIVAQMPDYKWEINGGVVNIFPAKNRDELFRELLAVRIAKFDLDKPLLLQFQKEILAMPELTKFVKDNDLCITDFSGRSIVNSGRKLPDAVHFSDLTIKELFNRITNTKRGGWILRRYRYPTGKECLSIQI